MVELWQGIYASASLQGDNHLHIHVHIHGYLTLPRT